eukprot:gnl/TRDRNA2_/TRDRNA2_90096_c1_seq1.p1 gnl/TRDRNA2_/TRDRNA2_90096_c1~~gnl/TRDRNA2_/TRDRNA2_90096_c1_seq1.p1  ORF type:complete len:109 (-),score=17.16 gnl/TRDRNA2_/TRDRNA2_90096_c1_seq1:2-328(-)
MPIWKIVLRSSLGPHTHTFQIILEFQIAYSVIIFCVPDYVYDTEKVKEANEDDINEKFKKRQPGFPQGDGNSKDSRCEGTDVHASQYVVCNLAVARTQGRWGPNMSCR